MHSCAHPHAHAHAHAHIHAQFYMLCMSMHTHAHDVPCNHACDVHVRPRPSPRPCWPAWARSRHLRACLPTRRRARPTTTSGDGDEVAPRATMLMGLGGLDSPTGGREPLSLMQIPQPDLDSTRCPRRLSTGIGGASHRATHGAAVSGGHPFRSRLRSHLVCMLLLVCCPCKLSLYPAPHLRLISRGRLGRVVWAI